MIIKKTKISKIIFGKNQGGALITAMLVFVVLVSVMSIVYTVFTQNFSETVTQEAKIQAYYVSASGIELVTTALLLEDVNGNKMIDNFKNQAPAYLPLNDIIDVGRGKATVKVERIVANGEPWAVITSVGEIKSTSGKITKNTSIVKINALNPKVVRWEVQSK